MQLLLLLKHCLCQGLHDWQQALQMLVLQQVGVLIFFHTLTVSLATVSAPIKLTGRCWVWTDLSG
jgi:hypothetical protein